MKRNNKNLMKINQQNKEKTFQRNHQNVKQLYNPEKTQKVLQQILRQMKMILDNYKNNPQTENDILQKFNGLFTNLCYFNDQQNKKQENIQKQKKQMIETIQNLHFKVDQEKKKLKSFQNNQNNYKNQIQKLNLLANKEKRKRQSLQEQINSLKEKIQHKQNQFLNLSFIINQEKTERQSLEKQKNQIKLQNIQDIKHKNNQLQAIIFQLQNENDFLKKQHQMKIQKQCLENQQLKKKIEKLKNQNISLKQSKNVSQYHLMLSASQIQKLNYQINECNNKDISNNKQSQRYQQKIQKMEAENLALVEQNKNIKQNLRLSNAQATKLSQKFQIKKQNINEYQKQILLLMEQNYRLNVVLQKESQDEKQFKYKQPEIDFMNKTIINLQKNNAKLIHQKTLIEDQVKTIKENLKLSAIQNQKIMQEINEYKKRAQNNKMNDQLKESLKKLTNLNTALILQTKVANHQNQKIIQQLNQKKIQNLNLIIKAKQERSIRQQFQKQFNKLKIKMKDYQKKKQEQQKLYQNQRQIQNLQIKIQNLYLILNEEKTKTQCLSNQLNLLKQEIEIKSNQIFNLNLEINQKKVNIQSLEKLKLQLENLIDKNNQSIERLKIEQVQNNSKIKDLQQRLQSQKKQNKQFEIQFTNMQKTIQFQSQRNIKITKDHNQEVQKLVIKNQQLNDDINSKTNYIQKLEKQIKDFKNGDYYQKFKKTVNMDIVQNKLFKRKHILQQNTPDKLWLMNQIQSFCKKGVIKMTKFIYKFDKDNRSSIHRYIDNVPNLILILKTTDGAILGTFCEQPLLKKQDLKQCKGFIFALNQNRSQIFQYNSSKQNAIFLKYENNYLTYGNQELMFRIQGPEVLINVNNPKINFFNTRDEKSESFLDKNCENNQATILSYEYYQLQFEEEEKMIQVLK